MTINIIRVSDGSTAYDNLAAADIMLGADRDDGNMIVFCGDGTVLHLDRSEYLIESAVKEPVREHTPSLEETKLNAIAKSKEWVAKKLEIPILFGDKPYSVTSEKQALLSAQLGMFVMNAQAGAEYPLTWNAVGEVCEPWEFADLLALSNAIAAHVGAIVKRQQEAEVAISSAESKNAIDGILTGLETAS